ncbi:hypothetical protein [Pseudophaeobacter sp.]|uniref:hypothetical protein n=1 Tax=Pseudophaeobacter sp. TaxID=1971739 RepID=UPI003A97021C
MIAHLLTTASAADAQFCRTQEDRFMRRAEEYRVVPRLAGKREKARRIDKLIA